MIQDKNGCRHVISRTTVHAHKTIVPDLWMHKNHINEMKTAFKGLKNSKYNLTYEL